MTLPTIDYRTNDRRRPRLLEGFLAGLLPILLFAGSPAAASMGFDSALLSPAEPRGGGYSDLYLSGRRALDEGRFAEAAEIFGRVAGAGGPEADAALYWKAYALAKAGRPADALKATQQLAAAHPKSQWLDDAQALEVELRGRTGRGADSPGGESEELKLYALNALLHVDSARAVPMLQRFLQGEHSPRLKEQALFVLSQSDAPEARRVLGEIAGGRAAPELQVKAIEMLGVAGDVSALGEIYRTSSDARARRAILHAYLVADAQTPLLAAARGEKDPALRRQAIQLLGAMDASAELRQLYRDEPEPALRGEILQALGVADDTEGLGTIARHEKDLALRRRAIQGLGIAGGERASRILAEIYAASPDRETRRAVVDALFVADDAATLIELFRAEPDRGLKREIVEKLSLMDSEEATDLLLRILEE